MLKPTTKIKLMVSVAMTCALLAVPSFADSQARIVRLSDVEGDVQIDRNTGQGYEKAFLNLPITAGTKLRANKDGRAEVEFEDGSTLRITPGTVVGFPELSMRDSGDKVSIVDLQDGTAYVNFAGSKGDGFTLNFGREALALTNSAHVRVSMGDTQATLAVFKGDVQADGPSGVVRVGSKQSATFDLTGEDKYTLAKNLEQDPYDSWDKQQQEYHERYASNSSYGNSYSGNSYGGNSYSYGMSDLNYYGNYVNAPGFGMMWQPYFAGVGWDPFMNGSWVYYPGYGYTWVSAYPWGWMPYRYGSWNYVPGYGWGWRPGTSYRAWNTVPRLVNPPQGYTQLQPPTTPGGTVVVNRGPWVNPGGTGKKMVIPNDSAGLGIPRGGIHDMGKVSQQVRQQGSVTTTVHPIALPAAPPRAMTPATRSTVPTHTSPPRMSTPTPHATPTPHTSPQKQ